MSTTTTVSNAATVASLYEAFGRGDVAFILNHVDDSCEWTSAGGNLIPAGGIYKGKAVGNFFKDLSESVDFTEFNPSAIHNIGNNEVVAFGNMSGNSKKTGKPS